MINVYLFDWGDTLMVDYPDSIGKMCDWDCVKAIDGASETLEQLSKHAQIYIATGADDSTEIDIKRAFERVGLAQYIAGYFCKENIGLSKGSPEFINAILTKLDLNKLNISSNNVAMVGDSLKRDIEPAISAGIRAFWFTQKNSTDLPNNAKVIKVLTDLIKQGDINETPINGS